MQLTFLITKSKAFLIKGINYSLRLCMLSTVLPNVLTANPIITLKIVRNMMFNSFVIGNINSYL